MRNLAYWRPQKIRATKSRKAPPKPQHAPKQFPSILMVVLMVVAAMLAFSLYNQKKQTAQPQVSDFFTPTQASAKPKPSPTKNTTVETIFLSEIPNLDGTWGVFVKDLKTGITYTYNDSQIFQSASLYKLAVMWKTFSEIKKGNLQEDSSVGSWSVKGALNSMITVSNNDSAIALAERFGWSNIEKEMVNEGFSSFDLTGADSPTVNAADIGKLLERIYANTAVDSKSSESMKTLLFAQQINDRIPKNLPTSVKVGHKTGEIDGYRHDAGIVMGKKSHYIFVFMTQTSVPEETKVAMANLAKEIYDALENN